MSVKQPILLIDVSALFRRAWHTSSEVSHAYESTVGGVNRAISMTESCLVAICCDSKTNWRKEISKEYKAQREAQSAQLYAELDRTIDRLRRDGHWILKFEGFESDDVIATAVQMATTRGHWCRIVSHDKDLLQLLSVACDYLAIHKTPWEVVDRDIVVTRYGVEASQFGDWLALVGDSSDNVKGCPGVGAKTATALLQAHGSLDNLMAGIGNGIADLKHVTPNIRKNLEAYKDQIELARKLVSLRRDVPIKFDEIYETREIQPIDDKDQMSEAEKDADKYFGVQQKEASAQAETLAADSSEQPEEQTEEKEAEISQGSAPPAEEDKQLTVAEPTEVATIVEYSKQLEPHSFKEAFIAAKVFWQSRIYSRYPTAESICAAIIRGREMGYGSAQSLDVFHVADFRNDGNLRLMMHAHCIIDRAIADPNVEYFELIESTATLATYEGKNKKARVPTRITYTIEDARKANLVKPNSAWEKNPAALLRKTAGVLCARVVSPGFAGLGLYSPEEMGIEV